MKLFKKTKLFLLILVLMIWCSATFSADGQFPVIYNVTLTDADTEYSQVLPAGTKKITVQCRTNYDVRVAYETGKVATPTAPYITIKAGSVYWEDHITTKLSGATMYFASSQAGVVIEIVAWN